MSRIEATTSPSGLQRVYSPQLLLLGVRNQKSSIKSLSIRGVGVTLIEETTDRILRGKVITERRNVLPGRIFLEEPKDDIVWKSIEEAGITVPKNPLKISRAEAEDWQIIIDKMCEERQRNQRSMVGSDLSPCCVGDNVIVFMGDVKIEGKCTWVGLRYVRVSTNNGKELSRVPFYLVARIKNSPLQEDGDRVISSSSDRKLAQQSKLALHEDDGSRSSRRRRNRHRRRNR